MGSQLETEGGGMFSSERVRLSAKIETAAAELDDARRAVALKAAVWTEDIGKWTARLDMLTKGAGDEGPGWFDQLYVHNGGIVENSAPVTAVGASNTRMGKLSAGRSVLSANPSNAEVYVLTENEIAIELVTAAATICARSRASG